ncbi:wall-associated receptor kinase 3 [Prunus avium]|uniref:non-specific serine/threonine protein kinase n=1 Tax=Prunus avium TaxID=42229 RepID=A0A6P5TUK9_PRUAV|nr:wall-associated receptor kinase 3 [Prunus avium]
MKLPHRPSTTIFSFIFIFLLPSSISSQICQRSCGKFPLKFPFGSDLGCGDPRFHQYVSCSQGNLMFTTHRGSYPVTNIDYTNKVMYISDPSMSTCSCTQPSKGFGLDWDAPFSFQDDNIFALLDCSTSSSPIFQSNTLYTDKNNSSKVSLCDNQGTSICSFLYSCRAISTINLPISTCCVYTPVDLGPAFDMDLQILQCSSYSGFYSFNERQSDPNSWNYGIALKYKFSVNNEYPSSCPNCERSNGICGYYSGGAYNSFLCNCPNGINTTNDCYFGANYNYGSRLSSWQIGTWLFYCLACLLISVWASSFL